MGVELELDAPGAIFYESLFRVIKRKTRCELNRQLDEVRFTTTDRDNFKICCWVSLRENRVTRDWANAVKWLNRRLEEGCEIYAVVGPDDEDVSPD
jgi:hypothetical protein